MIIAEINLSDNRIMGIVYNPMIKKITDFTCQAGEYCVELTENQAQELNTLERIISDNGDGTITIERPYWENDCVVWKQETIQKPETPIA